jgi:hypothetical protein
LFCPLGKGFKVQSFYQKFFSSIKKWMKKEPLGNFFKPNALGKENCFFL